MNYKAIKKQCHTFYKTYPKQTLLTIIFVLTIIFLLNNDFCYKTPIGKVIKVKTEQEKTLTNHNNGTFPITEKSYLQTLTVKLLNTDKKGSIISLKNSYSFSQMDSVKLARGDKVFLSLGSDGSLVSSNIQGIKRDSYTFILLALFIYLILLLTGKRGVFVTLTTLLNLGIFILSLHFYSEGIPILLLANILIFVFPCITLLLSNGIKKSTFVALSSTFLTLTISFLLFKFALTYGEEIDYAALDYIVGGHDLEQIFFASVELAGLGVIMDVSVSLCSSLYELNRKTPDIALKDFFLSGRQIGYDIMGTMINVLLFTYVCGLMPLIILKMKNDISLITIIKLQIPFEICRFLFGSIQILLAIPISILLSSLFLLKRRNKK